MKRYCCTVTSSGCHAYLGDNLSGTLQGAGGIGGLVAVSIGGQCYLPCYDNLGNVGAYVDENGSKVATYTYDAFGNTIASSGSMRYAFPHRFSTKYCDEETGLYYYGYRFYSPELGRWMNRDPIGESGGINLYSFCKNTSPFLYDILGMIHAGMWEEIAAVVAAILFERYSDDLIINKCYGGKEEFIAETSRQLAFKGSLSASMWNRAVELSRGKGYSAPAFVITTKNQKDWSNAITQIRESQEYKQKTAYIMKRLREGTRQRGFVNIEFNSSSDLAYSIHGAQLHYHQKGECVTFMIIDDYNFDKTHMWKKLQDNGDIATYPVIILMPQEKLGD